jgi:hypothetical protein
MSSLHIEPKLTICVRLAFWMTIKEEVTDLGLYPNWLTFDHRINTKYRETQVASTINMFL